MKRQAYTLVETLVVIGIIAVLMGLLLGAVQRAREAANRAQCLNNLKQIALAAHGYHGSNRRFPPGAATGPGYASSLVYLLPYVEQGNLYQRFDLTQNVYSTTANSLARTQQVPLFLCPSDPSTGAVSDVNPPKGQPPDRNGQTNYHGNMGISAVWQEQSGGRLLKEPRYNGIFALNSRTSLLMITDGASNTALYAEVKRGAAPNSSSTTDVAVVAPSDWDMTSNPMTNPNNLAPPTASCDAAVTTYNDTGLEYCWGVLNNALYTHSVPPNYTGRDCTRNPVVAPIMVNQGHLAARSYHPGGVNVAFADGSVRFISDSIPLDTWKALGTRSGGEVLDAGDF
jgi:prepilin-type processing-associated H-X9-DG protein